MDKLYSLKNYIKSKSPYLLLGGDNFYPIGINENNKETSEKEFNKIFGELKSKMHAVLGNLIIMV